MPIRLPRATLRAGLVTGLAGLLVGLLVGVAGCGSSTVVDPPASGRSDDPGYEVTVVEPDFDSPAPVVLRLDDGRTRELTPWSWCMVDGCADGAPPVHPFSVGSPGHVDFTFAIPGFEFDASFHRPTGRPVWDGPQGRTVEGRVEKVGEHTFRVWPAGPPGPWHVDLSGRGDGDLVTTFLWETPTAGPLPSEATGTVGVLAEHDGELDSYGVELFLDDLDPDAPVAQAWVRVTSDTGGSVLLDLGRPEPSHQPGTLSWIRGDRVGDPAVALGGTSFVYEVTLEMDGRTYTGRGRWPEETNHEITPHVPLAWSPSLPVYDGRD
jgi:hypothetical protein